MKDVFARPAARIAITYLIVASLWILFSDLLLQVRLGGAKELHWAQTLKGWTFVVFTSVLLYVLMKRTFDRMKEVAFEDRLSGLPNRLAFTEELQRRCQRSAVQNYEFSLTILDVDHFTDLNDIYGHGQGDILLRILGRRLVTQLGEHWYIARLGGDEFGLLSPANADPTLILAKLDSLQRSLTQDDGHPLLCYQTISAGTSHFPLHGSSSQDLLQRADMALSSAKARGRNQHNVYHEELERNLIERTSLLADLRVACDKGAFSLVYQPQWSVSPGCWTGVEVLIRWYHPERGTIPPDAFIPLAEKEGLIAAITAFVVEQSLEELKAAGITRDRLPCVSFNLSHPVLLNDATMDGLFSTIRGYGDDSPRIMMELTETAAMEDLDATLAAMHRWRREGIEFSIDDFGTGYSSLARLKQMPISELKVDRRFIQDIPHDQNDAVITKAILAMAQTLSLNVVAEGVETKEQVDFLTAHDCTSLQGRFLAYPMPIESLQKLLESRQDSPVD